MKEVLQEILDAEKEAEEKVKQAREDAAKIRREADERCEEILKNAREEAHGVAREIATRAEEAVEKEYRAELEKAEENKNRFIEEESGRIDALVDRLTGMILSGTLEESE